MISNRWLKLYLFFSNFSISFLSFFVQPIRPHFFDTVRFNALLTVSRNISSKEGYLAGLDWLNHFSEYSNQPFVAFYIWLFTFFKNNGFFFFGTTFIFIGIVMLFMITIKKMYSLKKDTIITVMFLFFGFFNMFFEIEGVRNFLAFIIIAFCMFLDFNKKANKLTIWSGYIVAIFIHPFALIFVLLRVAFGIIDLYKGKIRKILMLILFETSLLYNLVAVIFVGILIEFNSIPFINLLTAKMQNYVAGQQGFQAFAGYKEIIFTTFLFLILIFDFYIFNYLYKNSISNDFESYCKYILLLFVFTIGSLLSTQLYLRTIMLILFFMLPLIAKIFSYDNSNAYENIKVFGFNIRIQSYIILVRIINIVAAVIMMFHWYRQTNRFVELVCKGIF